MFMGSNTDLFVTLVCFWTLLAIFTYSFHDTLLYGDTTDLKLEGDNVLWYDGTTVNNFVENNNVVKAFLPIFSLLTFQYPNVPQILVLFLDMTFIFSGYVIFSLVRGVGS